MEQSSSSRRSNCWAATRAPVDAVPLPGRLAGRQAREHATGGVEHKFVNNVLTHADRTDFAVTASDWQEIENFRLKDRMIALLRDWGAGLELGLYEEAAAHLCGQPPDVESNVEVRLGNRSLGAQRMRLASPDVAIRIAPCRRICAAYQADLQSLLDHTDLRAIQWINIARPVVHFTTVRKGE